MIEDLCQTLTVSFLKTSWDPLKTLVEALKNFDNGNGRKVTFFRFENGKHVDLTFDGNRFFLRGSVEYSNPQLTVEEVQGIIGARLLEVCGNYFLEAGLKDPGAAEIGELCERLKKPPEGRIVAFLLNTDDVEPDRYSMNPLKESLVSSGQSAFPAAYVRTDKLQVDQKFVSKYEGTLISKAEADLIAVHLAQDGCSYLDFVDAVKYAQLEGFSEAFGMDLTLPALRMPLATLQAESKDGLLHYIISQTHKDFDAVKQAYSCMGRSITNRTTMLTIAHSKLGYGSKRAARGKLLFDDSKLEKVTVNYKTTPLYPNAIDPDDVSVAQAEDKFAVEGARLADYSFGETPSSPQFFLYSMGSPENAALWHGVGAFASPQLLQSYTTARGVCRRGEMVAGLTEKYEARMEVPLQFNLEPEGMWVHPVHRNIDASIGCVKNLTDLARMGMKIEYLSKYK